MSDLMVPSRRGFLKGLAGILAVGVAPAIIRTPGLIMPIKPPNPLMLSIGGNINTWGFQVNDLLTISALEQELDGLYRVTVSTTPWSTTNLIRFAA